MNVGLIWDTTVCVYNCIYIYIHSVYIYILSYYSQVDMMCGSGNLPAWNSNFERERREIMTNCEIWGYLIFRQTLMATAKFLWKYRMWGWPSQNIWPTNISHNISPLHPHICLWYASRLNEWINIYIYYFVIWYYIILYYITLYYIIINIYYDEYPHHYY